MMNNLLSEQLKNLPQQPGVYIYRDSTGKVIYVGKALNLSKRVKQYFQRTDALGMKTVPLVNEISSLETIVTQSEFDALLLEAKLIKTHFPKFNTIAKDDKSPLYIALTIDETLPRVRLERKPKASVQKADDETLYFGPFQSAHAARSLLRSLRHIVPYCTQKERTGKACFYTHLGLCAPCPSYISKLADPERKTQLTKQYRRNIFRLRDILSGQASAVILELERSMVEAAKQEDFESAASLRNQLDALRTLLTKRYDPAVYMEGESKVSELVASEVSHLVEVLQIYYPELTSLTRIECYDISNIQGTNPTASMVVMTDGSIDRSQYRKFRIKGLTTPNDFLMMQEVLKRRFNHPEWPHPDLLVIDGGKGQVSAAMKALSVVGDRLSVIPLIGLAKRQEEIIVPVSSGWKVVRLPFAHPGLKMLIRLRDEAHRFAITYHRLLRAKAALPDQKKKKKV